MIPEIIAGIGLGKLSEEVMDKRERGEEFLIDGIDDEDDIDWCPEMESEDDY